MKVKFILLKEKLGLREKELVAECELQVMPRPKHAFVKINNVDYYITDSRQEINIQKDVNNFKVEEIINCYIEKNEEEI